MTESDWGRFAEKVLLALETSRCNDPESGTSGLEVEFNILDQDLVPVAQSAGPSQTISTTIGCRTGPGPASNWRSSTG